MASSLSTTRFLLSQRNDVAKNKNKGKKPKLSESSQNSNATDKKLVRSIDKYYKTQRKLNKLHREASLKVIEVERKYDDICMPLYDKRNDLVKTIPSFWSTALLNHPALGELLSVKDRKIFKHLICLKVEDFRDIKSGYLKIRFFFSPNPYFEEPEIAKTYAIHGEGLRITTTTIKWKDRFIIPSSVLSRRMQGNKRPPPKECFFSWFADPQPKNDMDERHDKVADMLKNLWEDPLTYFITSPDKGKAVEEEEIEEDMTKGFFFMGEMDLNKNCDGYTQCRKYSKLKPPKPPSFYKTR